MILWKVEYYDTTNCENGTSFPRCWCATRKAAVIRARFFRKEGEEGVTIKKIEIRNPRNKVRLAEILNLYDGHSTECYYPGLLG